MRQGLLDRAQAVKVFEFVQDLYPKVSNAWIQKSSGLSDADLRQINTTLMESFWELLETLPSSEKRYFVKQGARSNTPDFFHFLCRKSLELGRKDPNCGVETMELALDFLRGNGKGQGDNLPRLKAQGLSRLANAHRLASDFVNARKYLVEAREAWSTTKERDELIEAEIDFYEATVYLLEGELRGARDLFNKAVGLCKRKPPGRLLVQCLSQRSGVLGYGGDLESAICDLRTAEDVLARLDEPRLELTVAANLALFHVMAAQIAEAEEHLARAWALCDEAGDLIIRQHLLWTRGLIGRARSELEAAADFFETA